MELRLQFGDQLREYALPIAAPTRCVDRDLPTRDGYGASVREFASQFPEEPQFTSKLLQLAWKFGIKGRFDLLQEHFSANRQKHAAHMITVLKPVSGTDRLLYAGRIDDVRCCS